MGVTSFERHEFEAWQNVIPSGEVVEPVTGVIITPGVVTTVEPYSCCTYNSLVTGPASNSNWRDPTIVAGGLADASQSQTEQGLRNWFFNGYKRVEPGEYGMGTWEYPCVARYDPLTGTPFPGSEWGPTAGGVLSATSPIGGFQAIGVIDGDRDLLLIDRLPQPLMKLTATLGQSAVPWNDWETALAWFFVTKEGYDFPKREPMDITAVEGFNHENFFQVVDFSASPYSDPAQPGLTLSTGKGLRALVDIPRLNWSKSITFQPETLGVTGFASVAISSVQQIRTPQAGFGQSVGPIFVDWVPTQQHPTYWTLASIPQGGSHIQTEGSTELPATVTTKGVVSIKAGEMLYAITRYYNPEEPTAWGPLEYEISADGNLTLWT